MYLFDTAALHAKWLQDMADAQKLYQMEDRVSGVRLKVDDLFQAPRIARELVRYQGDPVAAVAAETEAQARDAARLAKADLVTLMVREFPELQGVMGGTYLAGEGVAAEVADSYSSHCGGDGSSGYQR